MPIETLARLRPGEHTRIRKILFDSLREHCARRGVHEGDAVSCSGAGGPVVLVALRDGTVVPCDRDWARFVAVVPMEGGSADR